MRSREGGGVRLLERVLVSSLHFIINVVGNWGRGGPRRGGCGLIYIWKGHWLRRDDYEDEIKSGCPCKTHEGSFCRLPQGS